MSKLQTLSLGGGSITQAEPGTAMTPVPFGAYRTIQCVNASDGPVEVICGEVRASTRDRFTVNANSVNQFTSDSRFDGSQIRIRRILGPTLVGTIYVNLVYQ
jgi:hypothetical protein